MTRLNGWIRLGIVTSAAWIALATFVYVTEIVNHPSFVASQATALDGYFHWVDDLDAIVKAHAEAKAQGKDFTERYVFQQPTFSPLGYVELAFLPVLISWLGTYAIVWAFRWVRKEMRGICGTNHNPFGVEFRETSGNPG